MRKFAAQGLASGLAIAAAAALACGEPAAVAPGPAARPPVADPVAESPTPAARADLPEPPAGSVYYRYVEAGGSVRFVARLDDVPAAARAEARPIAMRSGAALPHPAPRAAQAVAAKPARRALAGAAEASAAPRSQHEVVVYTTSWCPWCKKTLRWLDDKRVAYVNKDIEANPAWRAELVEKTGRTSIPVVEIDGQQIRGFDQAAMERLL